MAEVQQVLVGQPAFEIGPRIHSGRCMPLEVDKVAGLIAVSRVEEMVITHFQQRGERGIGGEMAADAGIFLVLAMNHRHRVPADEALQPLLKSAVAGVRHFFMFRDGIQVGVVSAPGVEMPASRAR